MHTKKKRGKVIVISLFIFLIIFSIISFIVVKICFDDMFQRTKLSEFSVNVRYEDVKDQYDRELLNFMSGKNKLQGYLYGVNNTKGLVVIAHGIGGGAENYMAQTLYFVDQGYQVFAFDNTGCYESEGVDCIGLPQSAIDLDAALSYIESESRFDGLPVFLFGHSWGGYAVTAVLNYSHDITAVASVAGFNDPMTMIMEWGERMMGVFAYVEFPYIYTYQKLLLGDDLTRRAVDGINKSDTPVLIIHGTDDEAVEYDGVGTINYRDEITNPNVEYYIREEEKQNGHGNLMYSLDAMNYVDELDEEYNQLYEQYDGEIDHETEVAFYSKADKQRASQLDDEFMQHIIAFYEKATTTK